MSSTNRQQSKSSLASSSLRRRSSININDYIFQINHVLSEPSLRKLYRKHLETEHSTETIDFFDAVETLFTHCKHHPAEVDRLLTEAHLVFDRFVADGAPEEINLGASNKFTLRALLAKEDSSNKYKDEDLKPSFRIQRVCSELLAIQTIIVMQMEKDSFPRFVRNRLFIDHIIKQDLEFVGRIAKLRRTIEYSYKDADFTREVVTDEDFHFMESLADDDPDWDLMGWTASNDGSTVSAWFNTKRYFPEVKDMAKKGMICKFTGVFPFPLDLMSHTLVPGKNVGLYDRNAVRYHEVRYQSFEELNQRYPGSIRKQPRGCVTCYFDVELPFPMTSKRRYVICSSLMYDPTKDQVMLLHKPLTDHGLSGEGSLNDIWDFQYYRLRKLDENHTQFVQIHCYNLKGWATSRTLQKLIVFDRAKKFQKHSTNVLCLARDGKLSAAPREDLLYRLLLEQNIEQQREEHRRKIEALEEDQ